MKNSSFQFTNPVLLKLDFKINEGFNMSPDGTTNIQLTTNVNINKSNQDKNEAIVTLTLTLGVEDNTSPFFITGIESAKFKWTDQDQKLIDALLNQNAPALLLGYLRPIIATITGLSPFNAYNIPFINFTKH